MTFTPMRRHSVAFPWVLIFVGLGTAIDFALDRDALAFAGACLVAAAGFLELHTTNTRNADIASFAELMGGAEQGAEDLEGH